MKTTKTTDKEIAREEASYFVSLKNPVEVRRHILESCKKSLYGLQNYQRLLLIREKKLKEMSALKESIRELMYLNKRFNDKLPPYETDLLNEVKKIEKESATAFKKVNAMEKRKTVPKHEKTELEKLEDSLNSIESKLKNLDVQ